MAESLAISLLDLDRLAPTIYRNVIVPNVIKEAIQVGSGVEEVAVQFSCSLLQAALICDKIRSDDRSMGDYETRIYYRRDKYWIRIPEGIVLTRVIDGKVELDPSKFDTPQVAAAPLPQKKLQLGRKANASN